jgi:hypothetical protein
MNEKIINNFILFGNIVTLKSYLVRKNNNFNTPTIEIFYETEINAHEKFEYLDKKFENNGYIKIFGLLTVIYF